MAVKLGLSKNVPFRMFQNRMLRRMFRPEMEEVTGG
jgi:hypothetical protein